MTHRTIEVYQVDLPTRDDACRLSRGHEYHGYYAAIMHLAHFGAPFINGGVA